MILGITIVIAFGLSMAGCGSWITDGSIWSRGTWNPQHHTLKELRDLHVVKQQKDYSCGAAALATLMIYYFGDNTSEEEILNLLQSRLDDDEKRKKMIRGFSLLDL